MANITGTNANDTLTGTNNADTITGLNGNDTINAGGGNDNVVAGPATQVNTPLILNWSAAGGDESSIAGGFTQNTGGVNATVTYTDNGGGTGFTVESSDTQYRATGETFSTTSAASLAGTGLGPTSTVGVSFAGVAGQGFQNEVTNVSFRLNDIDSGGWQDIVTVLAYDAAGNLVPVTFTPAGNDTVSGNTITAGPTSDTTASAQGSVLISIAGPVQRFEVIYSNGSTAGQMLNITNIHFQAQPLDNDSVLGGAGNDTIDGGFGNDFLNGEGGADSLIGGLGNDTLLGGAGIDTLSGGDGNDSLDGGTENDLLSGGAGADTLLGGAGLDTIDGGTEADSIDGGDGDDQFVLTGTFGNDTITGGEASETAGDTINSTAVTANQTLTFTGGEAGTISDGTSTATFSQVERFLLGSGNDTVNGAAANAPMYVDGGAGNDSMLGGTANDTLLGGTGNDTLNGGTGADSLTGGDGDDRFVLTGTFGADTIIGGSAGETIGDTINSTTITANQTVTFTGGEAGSISDGTSTATFSDIERFLLGSGNDTVNGNAANASMYVDGGAGNDSMQGGSANDTLLGGIGTDSINGGAGNDSLDGGDGNDTLTGGLGNDTMTGGLGSDRFLGITAGDVVDGFEDAPSNENDILDIFGSGWTKANTTIVFSDPSHENGTVFFFNPDGTPAGQMSFTNIETVVPCFTPGTMIETDRGPRAVETLRLGNMVLTMDHGLQPIRWIGRRDLTPADLALQPKLRPVLIREGALGAGLPARDMRVSPQHRLLMTGAHAELISGEAEALAPALYFVGQPGIVEDAAATGISYIHLMFDQHEIVQSDGLWSESFQPGAATMAGMDEAQRDEILSLFPTLPAKGHLAYPAARSSLKRYEVLQILAS